VRCKRAGLNEKIRGITRKRPAKVSKVIQELNPVLRGWANYYRIGNSRRAFDKIRDYTAMKVRRFIRRKQAKRGFGYRELTDDFLYKSLGLYSDWNVVHQ